MVMITVMMMVMVLMRSPQGSCRSGYFEDDGDGDDDGDDDGDRSMGVTARPTKLPSEASPNRPPSETPTRRAIHLPVCQKSSKSPICCVLLNLLCFGRNWSITGFLPSRSFPAHHRVYLTQSHNYNHNHNLTITIPITQSQSQSHNHNLLVTWW